MATHHQNEHDQEQPSHEQTLQEFLAERDIVAPGVPIVRANTPRPLSFTHSASKNKQASSPGNFPASTDFPVEAPAAPPLPEEPEGSDAGTLRATASIPVPVASERPGTQPPEFIWLFEYGLEMDSDRLNSPAMLNGQARIYGQAVLKGYRIEGLESQNGQVAVTLAKTLSPEQEVWGILYRIPRRLTEQSSHEPSVLDNAHAGYPFTATPIVAQEMYRKRPVQCITYMLSETALQGQIQFLPADLRFNHSYARRLLEAARRQKLPETYLEELALLIKLDKAEPPTAAPQRIEQNTEPLPIIPRTPFLEPVPGSAQDTALAQPASGWFFALAIYLVGLLTATLALAVMQALGYWNQVFNASFAPLGTPWYVLLYGLLGGCISCIMALGRSVKPAPPGFVILTWFTRPYLGAVLAALAYLLLSSGLFALSIAPEQRYATFSVVGAVAGLSEGWLLFRRK